MYFLKYKIKCMHLVYTMFVEKTFLLQNKTIAIFCKLGCSLKKTLEALSDNFNNFAKTFFWNFFSNEEKLLNLI